MDRRTAAFTGIMLARVQGIDGLLCLLTDRVDAELLDAAGPQLKVVSNHAVGFDNIVVPDCTARGIPVGNTPGILTDATADFAWALLMAAAAASSKANAMSKTAGGRRGDPSLLLGSDIAGATLGIVGFGRIGQAMAKRASGFGMRIIYFDSRGVGRTRLEAESVDFDTLLRTVDFVSLHTPLLPETTRHDEWRGLCQDEAGAVLVNTSRGPVVDMDALYTALSDGANLRGRPGCHRRRNRCPWTRPLLDLGQSGHRAPHRQRQQGHARKDVAHGRGEPHRRPQGRAPADMRKSGSV